MTTNVAPSGGMADSSADDSQRSEMPSENRPCRTSDKWEQYAVRQGSRRRPIPSSHSTLAASTHHSPPDILSPINIAPSRLSLLRHSSFVIRHSSFVIRHSSFVIRHSSFVIRHSSFVIRHSSFVIRHSTFDIRHSPLPGGAFIFPIDFFVKICTLYIRFDPDTRSPPIRGHARSQPPNPNHQSQNRKIAILLTKNTT